MGTKCFGYKKTSKIIYKSHANWMGTPRHIVKQLLVSMKSYVVYPFAKKRTDATQKYFSRIYDRSFVDDLIFDAHSDSYLDKTKFLFQKGQYTYDYIFDCGCGEGNFLKYLEENKVDYENYIGIDFAISERIASNKIRFIKENIVSYNYNLFNGRTLFFLSNVLCYLSDEDLMTFLSKIKKDKVTMIIADPIPGVFWDATFAGVKLFYRKLRKVKGILQNQGFKVTGVAKDYAITIGNICLFPMSYAASFVCESNDTSRKEKQ